MKQTFTSQNCSHVQTEARPRQPHTFTVLPIPDAFRKTRWPDVSAIAYSHSTDDESIEEVLKELKILALNDLGSVDSKAPSEFSTKTLEGSTQFERTDARESRYSRVLRRVKTRERRYPTHSK
jgi:hypothetical protein